MRERTYSTNSRLVGRPASAVGTVIAAVVLTVLAAQWVASTGTYLQIEHSLPTYDGTPGALFVVAGAALVGLATLSASLEAGVLPSVLLAGGPVVGWAVNHVSAPVTPHYAATFPVEMAVLYGGVFGVLGSLLGSGIRRTMSIPRVNPFAG